MEFFSILYRGAEKTLSFLFPRRCLICGRDGKDLCLACIETLPETYGLHSGYIHSAFSYNDKKVRKLIRFFKYRKRKEVGEILAKMAFNAFSEDFAEAMLFKGSVAIVPISMPKRRVYVRGYNHAEIIAGVFSKHSGLPVVQALKRTRSGKPQAHISSREERKENARGIFSVPDARKKEIAGKTIFIVDDIVTTGSTIEDASRALKEAGAQNILAFTLAATPR